MSDMNHSPSQTALPGLVISIEFSEGIRVYISFDYQPEIDIETKGNEVPSKAWDVAFHIIDTAKELDIIDLLKLDTDNAVDRIKSGLKEIPGIDPVSIETLTCACQVDGSIHHESPALSSFYESIKSRCTTITKKEVL